MRGAVVALALDAWKLARMLQRVLARLEEEEARRYANQARFLLRSLDGTLTAAGYRLVELDGQPYDAGMAVTPLNAGDFDPGDTLFVEQMVEPVIMGPAGVVRAGTVLLAKGIR